MNKILSNTEINPVDEENFLWDFMQAFEEYKKDNQSRWITYRELFREFVQTLPNSEQAVQGSDTTEADSSNSVDEQNHKKWLDGTIGDLA